MADSLPVHHNTQTGNVRPPLFFPLCALCESQFLILALCPFLPLPLLPHSIFPNSPLSHS